MTERTIATKPSLCDIDGCKRERYGHGWCSKHYQRWRRHGDPTATKAETLGMTASQRFNHYYERSTVTASGCVEWSGLVHSEGYGKLWGGEKYIGAHIFSWEKDSGRKVVDGLQINHHCDNRQCVNSEHLYEGTKADNVRDMVVRRRYARGERTGTAKLTESAVLEIRAEYTGTRGEQKALARKHGISATTMHSILTRKTWAWLT